MNTRHTPSEHLKKEFLRLKGKLHEITGLQADERLLLQKWLGRLEAAPFGGRLVQNRRLEGEWVEDCRAKGHSSLFNEIPALAAMRLRHENIRETLEKYLFDGMTVGVFPAGYAKEWKCFEEESHALLIAINSKADLLQNPGQFDLIIQNTFLYDDGDEGDDFFGTMFSSLKSGGLLLTSAWIPPDASLARDIALDDLLFEALLGMKKVAYVSLQEMKLRLRLAGFDHIQTLGHENSRLKTLMAKKPYLSTTQVKHKRVVTHSPRRATKSGVCCKGFLLSRLDEMLEVCYCILMAAITPARRSLWKIRER